MVLLSSSLVIVFVISFLFYNSKRDSNDLDVNTEESEIDSYCSNNQNTSFITYDPPFQNGLDDLVKYADNVVLGTITSASRFTEGGCEFVLDINTEFKGNTESKTIHVYEAPGLLEVGGRYLLFLSQYEGGLYPSPIYTSLDKSFIISVTKQSFIRHSVPGKKLQETLQEIISSPYLTYEHPKDYQPLILPDTATLDELTEAASNIVHVKLTDFIVENKYMKVAEVDIIEEYKGHLAEDTPLYLPSTVSLREEYIVYLLEDSITIVASKHGSVVSKHDKEKWKQARRILKDKGY